MTDPFDNPFRTFAKMAAGVVAVYAVLFALLAGIVLAGLAVAGVI